MSNAEKYAPEFQSRIAEIIEEYKAKGILAHDVISMLAGSAIGACMGGFQWSPEKIREEFYLLAQEIERNAPLVVNTESRETH